MVNPGNNLPAHVSPCRIFLLSPANASGIRGQRLLSPDGRTELALRLKETGAPLGEVYRFISSLYFRGKLEYARQFKNAPPGAEGIHIITGAGLRRPETIVTRDELQVISATPIDDENPVYRLALERDLLQLRDTAGDDTEFILLGSIATAKYLAPLLSVFGDRLLFPREFLGRGDMSRGSLLLKCCSAGKPLAYLPAAILSIPSKKKCESIVAPGA